MLERNLDFDPLASSWNQMGVGAPTVIALAQLCGHAMITQATLTDPLTPEAMTILFAAKDRGILEIKATNTAYESPARFLTVFVELNAEGQKIRFRNNHDPLQNVRFFDGFRQLCASGLVMHHLYHEFSLTPSGFEMAKTISEDDVQDLLQFGQECVG